MYSIYKITSPSGKSYIGLTKSKPKERWRQHVKRSKTGTNHPFYNAIRKYGAETFTVEVIDSCETKAEAQQLERKHIALHDKALLYNLSPGGEADGEVGGKIFWDRMNQSPEEKAQYLEKLSQVKLANDWTDYEALQEKNQEWRRNNPRQAYRNSHRAIRIANRHQQHRAINGTKEDARDRKDRLMFRYKRSEFSRQKAIEQWARLSAEERKQIGNKISNSQKVYWSKITDAEERSRLTSAARASVDRKKQGAAASKGIKSWWDNLKADPVAYKAYMDRRTKSLQETNRRKKLENL